LQKHSATIIMEQNFALVKIERLENIYELLNKILKNQETNACSNNNLLHGEWINEKEAKELLGVKSTTLYKLRKSKQILATKTRPVFYNFASIKEYLNTMTND